MKYLAVTMLLAIAMTLVGCGSNGNPATINGTWNATLIDTNSQTLFKFGTSLVVNGDGTLTISNFQFTSNEQCFGQTAGTESGTFTLTGNFNGNVTGSFGFVVNSGNPSGNVLTLKGTATGNTISGTWSLSGQGCTGSGTFKMTKM
jgi:hypothetical protein